MQNEKYPSPDLGSVHIKKFLLDPPLLLEHFNYEDAQAFLKLGREEQYRTGDIVIQEGEKEEAIYLVSRGKLSLLKGHVVISELKEGYVFGESFLFKKFNSNTKIQSEGDVVLLKFDRFDILNFFKNNPKILFEIFTKNIINIQNNKINKLYTQVKLLNNNLLEKNYK